MQVRGWVCLRAGEAVGVLACRGGGCACVRAGEKVCTLAGEGVRGCACVFVCVGKAVEFF